MEEIKFNDYFSLIWTKLKQLSKQNYPNIPGEVLLPTDSTYVHRQADQELLTFLKNLEDNDNVCYILGPPQIGKSSLILTVNTKLPQTQYLSVGIEAKKFGKEVSEQSFYLEILKIIYTNIKTKDENLVNDLNNIWPDNQVKLSSIKFLACLKEIVTKLKKNIVIFIDNVETIIALQINENFLECLRSLSQVNKNSPNKVKFVLSGFANPFDFFDKNYDLLNLFKKINIESLLSNRQPLIKTLKNNNSAAILAEIINWTNGQPFLTQFLCQVVYNYSIVIKDSELNSWLKELVRTNILQQRTISSLDEHFQKIESYFIGGDSNYINRKLHALNLYSRILENPNSIKFSDASAAHWDLLISGLVTKSNDFLIPANPIYQQVFGQQWIVKVKKIIGQWRSKMPSAKIYNRKVYMLIDQSGSMTKKDPLFNQKVRWKAIKEIIRGHVYGILEHTGINDEKIGDEIVISLFSQNRPSPISKAIQDSEQVEDIFQENMPDSNTYIVPTLQAVIANWFATRVNQGGFIIIYTDGEIDDPDQFKNLVKETCARLNSQDDLKIVIIGIGSDVDQRPHFYLRLDANTASFTDRNGNPCDIVVFDLHHKMRSIIDLLDSQLVNPNAGSVAWGRDFCPELYD